ncbi:hypothetical protein H257_19443 [Aphanomyces astaci]|uniref:TROVE domain-containing protein n=1 Tax=Aphanomyces astaci TaxID=112090 RepID=W4F856_APHAT|nr:hypothetical protein H257_19443 [Aphanomyces astaci]ETV63627.1 hypothetical protein H257_19443 [Aphanomyces astaci]RQM15983.1 hypothetical protein B5M09_013969 [Aphanomyces astaci]|eukprot:XP_009846889.1 hypothetical protein H257_19443 [Aphanomyces astaci]
MASPALFGPTATTWNGAASNATSTSGRVDFYYGVLRNTPHDRVCDLVAASYKEDPLHTLKIVAYLRDCRGGKGERTVARFALEWLAIHQPVELTYNLKHYVAEYGRFDDLLALMGTPVESAALNVFASQLRDDLDALSQGQPVSLCAKWVPSEKKAGDKATRVTTKLAKCMGLTCAALRKTYLSPLRASLQLLERFMCANDWAGIDLNKVPSVAMHIHGKPKHAFERHLTDKFVEWKAGLASGQSKVNASVLFPHQVVQQYYNKSDVAVDALVEAQWQVMLQQARELGTLSRTLVMSDVSGSMSGLPMLVSIALGLLISDVVEDDFKGLVLTFESTPQFHVVRGDNLKERVASLADAPWGGSTDFIAALRLILTTAVAKGVTADSMPARLIVVSDMQFDQADRSFETNFHALQRLYSKAGFDMPHLIFWNVQGAVTDTPALASEANVSLLSGFSPSVLKAALTGETVTPVQTMMNAILDARYDLIRLPSHDSNEPDAELV